MNKANNKSAIRTIITGVLIIIFFISIVLMYYRMIYEEKREGLIMSGRMAASQAADQFSAYLSTNEDLIKFTAYTLDEMITANKSDAEIQDYLVGQSTAIRNAVIENSTGLYGYINGRFFSGTNWVPPDDYVATDRPWYTNAMSNPGQLTILEPYVDVQSGNTMLALGKTLCDGESVISVDISLDQMQKLTEEAVSGGGSDIEMILTGDGVVVTHSDISEVGKHYVAEDDSFGAHLVSMLGTSDDSFFEFYYLGFHYIAYDVSFGEDWHCISVHDATRVFEPLNRILGITIGVVLATVLILGAVLGVSNKRSIIAQKAMAENAAKTAFLSQMSHELRTPINAVLGMNEMILRECDDTKILGYSKNIKKSGHELLGFVDEILEYSIRGSEAATDKPSQNEDHEEKEHTAHKLSLIAPEAHILAVDDNPMNLTVLENLLRRTQIQLDTADSGDEGLRLAGETKYDLILMDHMMPDKDGIETFHELRSRTDDLNSNTPVICLTANAISGAREHYIAEGFVDYMTKPVDAGLLEEKLIRYLPGDKVEFVELEEEDVQDQIEIPECLLKLAGSDIIDIYKGMENSGSVEDYMALLKIFYDSVDDKYAEIEGYLSEGDITDYTIKVHALKSSARIIGAMGFGEEAQDLEDAGKREDMEYINEHHEGFMEAFMSFKDLLGDIILTEQDEDSGSADTDKPMADPDLMSIVYEEIKASAEEMDCDRLQAVFDDMEGYIIPEEEASLWGRLRTASNNYDYDAILQLMEDDKRS